MSLRQQPACSRGAAREMRGDVRELLPSPLLAALAGERRKDWFALPSVMRGESLLHRATDDLGNQRNSAVPSENEERE